MTRPEHLAFCGICKNRKFDFEKGILCKLTNTFADFKNECPDFKLDASQKNELLKKTEIVLSKALREKEGKIWKNKKVINHKSYSLTRQEFKNSKVLNLSRIGLGLFFLFFIIMALIQENDKKIITSPFFYMFLFFGIGLILISAKNLWNRKPIISVNEHGIKFKENEFSWIQIIDYQITEIPMRANNTYYLQFCTYPAARLIEIDVSDIDGTLEQLITTLEYHLKTL